MKFQVVRTFYKKIRQISYLISGLKNRSISKFLLKLYPYATTPLYKNSGLKLKYIRNIDYFMSWVRSPDDFDIYNFCGDLSFLTEFKYHHKILHIMFYILCTTTKLFLRIEIDELCYSM